MGFVTQNVLPMKMEKMMEFEDEKGPDGPDGGDVHVHLADGLYTKEECYRIEALNHASRIHEGLGTGSATVVSVAEVFERYLKTGR